MPNPPILLRPLDPERDGLSLHAAFGDEASCRFVSHPAFESPEETIAALARWTEGAPDTSWSIVEAADGPARGRISLIDRGRETWEAACMTVPSARGRNLSARGLAIAIDQVFAEKEAAGSWPTSTPTTPRRSGSSNGLASSMKAACAAPGAPISANAIR